MDGARRLLKMHGSGKAVAADTAGLLREGQVIRAGGVNFPRPAGDAMRLPPPTAAHRPELAGRSFEAMGVSAGGSSAEPLRALPAMPTCGSLLPKAWRRPGVVVRRRLI
ncbi:hypothetical protein LNQ52_17615 [Klebsiella pneumoniae subsp. pneumoniae]|nr:hypothetical protein [Klebsiella pneumoniae subsp. pneumoniae]